MEAFSALLALSPVNSPHKDLWCGALVFSLISAWINGWVNNREAGDLRRHRAHYDVTVMETVGRKAPGKHKAFWTSECRISFVNSRKIVLLLNYKFFVLLYALIFSFTFFLKQHQIHLLEIY